MEPARTDIAILGGGLAGGLIALAMAARRPQTRMLLIERDSRCGGDHVWSFFESDVAARDRDLVEPLVVKRWSGYDVAFPKLARSLATRYCSATGTSLDAALRARLPGDSLMTGVQVASAGAECVTLSDGRVIEAGAVIDARGPQALPHLVGGWQKFAGRLLRLAAPHGLERPLVMDATVAQHDGYRFVYCLPFSSTEVFVEDTYYSDGPQLDPAMLHRRIADYAAQRGWRVESHAMDETGVLPVIAGGDFDAFWRASACGPAPAGARAGLFHPLTSYSLPDAVRFASALCVLDKLSSDAVGRFGHAWAAKHWREGRFYRMLSRMLFAAAEPGERWRVLQRFYGLSEGLIERFYAGESTAADRLRILAGKPPVPLGAAMRSLAGRGRTIGSLG
ncbi:lycopene cyclase [Novosphingobium sp. PC22D]|uniref:lycopene beta-cyclase CrtY n=1 Tax=Novosphingobium sp. PC22D TaxID=1962403 RepID=UPI000BEF9096|nr:lycopene beta-cyclase CrtY [Novosphingobium sp. PC22D]PEQ14419.1 lycopene cyclase [Novosphingobium sp. PC22D]